MRLMELDLGHVLAHRVRVDALLLGLRSLLLGGLLGGIITLFKLFFLL
jgi:hypothetical protein